MEQRRILRNSGDAELHLKHIMSYYTYIVECADKSLYTGCTNDLKTRISQHNNAKSGARYTKIRRPVKLIYFEEFKTLAEGRHREAEIKRLKRAEKLKIILAHPLKI
jgi:putative endonuclease